MINRSAGFALTLQACPFIFTTAGVSTASAGDADWPSQATIIQSALRYTGWSWTERVSPIEGSLEVSSVPFTLDDVPITSGVLVDARPITWLCTRTLEEVGYTQLASTMAAADLSFTVDFADALGSFPRVVYCEQEAIYCDSIVGNVVTVNASGRGYYGTTARAHTCVALTGVAPPVFKDYPTPYRRKCVFWIVDEDGSTRPLYRGYIQNKPSSDGKQTAYVLTAGHLWNLERMRPLGVPSVATQLRGFNSLAFAPIVSYPDTPGAPLWLSSGLPPVPLAADAPGFIDNTLEGACSRATENLRVNLAAEPTGAITADVEFHGSRSRTTFRFSKAQGIFASPLVSFTMGNRQSPVVMSSDTVDPRTATAFIDGSPAVLYSPRPGQPVPLSRTDGFPTVWADTGNTTNGLTTSIQYVLRGPFNGGENTLVIAPDGNAPVLTSLGPTVTGEVTVEGPLLAGTSQGVGWGAGAHPRYGWIEEAVNLNLVAKIESPHWVLALRYGIIENTGVVNGGIDAASWDLDTFEGRVLNATDGGPSARTLYLDGSQTLDKLLGDTDKFNGCGVGLRASKMVVAPFQPPLATDAIALTVTEGQVVSEPSWSSMPDGIVNTVRIGTTNFGDVINDFRSQNLYGPAKPMAVTMDGMPWNDSATPDSIARFGMQHVTGLWADPASSLMVNVSLANLERVYLFDYIAVSEYSAPVGDGTRGLSGARGQVIGKKINIPKLGVGSVELEAILYPHSNLAGYAPCCRVASISVADLVIDVAYMPSSSTVTDYAGSNLTTYDGVANDGGAGKFAVDDQVQLIEVDNVSPRTPELFKVVAVTPSGTPGFSKITLDANPNAAWQTIITGGGFVELVYQDYDDGTGLQDGQMAYCFVGDETTNVIGTSTTRPRRFAP